MDLGLSDKTALVLGSTRGIGLATARMLAMEGCRVILCGRSPERLEDAVASVMGAKASGVAVDLANADAVAGLSDRIASGEIACDILVNNTGGPELRALTETGRDQWVGAVEAMLLPLFDITRAAVPHMQDRNWGRIVTIVSSGVQQPIPDLGISNTLRSSLLGWSKTLSNELAPFGITANCVVPGRIRTQRVENVDMARAKRLQISVDEAKRASTSAIPTGRYGEPEEMASAICFLASQNAAYITGTTLRVDGGLVRSI